ncbi:MAG: helix-turn-helix transcriptional regulator [Ruminococcaceae bacterium]|nr:helix-turn-helix transcriptional regulator [Oscillospiraceae bacterium]
MAESVKEIIASNLASLRKEHKLTQQQLAERINYSDKAVSRWENAETLPDIETLCRICDIYGVTFEYLLQKEQPKKNNPYVVKSNTTGKMLITFIILCSLWIAAILTYTYVNVIFGIKLWTVFVWAIPLSAVVCQICNAVFFKNKAFGCVLFSILSWTTILALYLQTLKYNTWMLFIMGVPLQAVIILITIFRYKSPEGVSEKKGGTK